MNTYKQFSSRVINNHSNSNYHDSISNILWSFKIRSFKRYNTNAFHYLEYSYKKAMERSNSWYRRYDGVEEMCNPKSEPNNELIFSENEDCYRVRKFNSLYGKNKRDIKHDGYKFEASLSDPSIRGYEDLKRYIGENKHRDLARIDNYSRPEPTWGNKTNGLPQNRDQFSKFNDVKYKTCRYDENGELTTEDDNQIPEFDLIRKSNVKDANIYCKENEYFKEQDEAYMRFLSEVTDQLKHQHFNTHNTENDFQQRERKVNYLHNTNEKLKLQRNPTIKTDKILEEEREKQFPSNGDGYKRIQKSIHVDQLQDNIHPANRNFKYSQYRDNQGRSKQNNHYSTPHSDQINVENGFNSLSVDDSNNDFNNGSNTIIDDHNHYFYPHNLLSQMYNWSQNYLGTPPTEFFNYQNYYWWALNNMPYQNQSIASDDNSIIYHQPYTGIAGYNWPTVRKKEKNSEEEENNDYPVYVKPPTIGSEKTEELRSAYLRYIKILKHRAFRRNARKRKQMRRRERNYKLRQEKSIKTGNSDQLKEEPENLMQNLQYQLELTEI